MAIFPVNFPVISKNRENIREINRERFFQPHPAGQAPLHLLRYLRPIKK
jgi:hypothetical protein